MNIKQMKKEKKNFKKVTEIEKKKSKRHFLKSNRNF